MATAGSTRENDGIRRARGRMAFFSWSFALLGTGTAVLSLLLVGGGVVAWFSAVGLLLLGFTLLGIVSLGVALASLFRARRDTTGGRAADGAPGGSRK